MAMKDVTRAQIVYSVSVALAWVLPIACIGFYAAGTDTFKKDAFGLAVLVMSASYLSGGLLGFLFALPRSITVSTGDRTDGGWTVRPNTNLEEVSDWLTKIVVGLTLVELGSIPTVAGDLFERIGAGFGGGEAAVLFAGALVIYSSAAGLIEAWLATRLFIIRWMNASDALTSAANLAESVGSDQAEPLRRAGATTS